jgi:Icc-related predicted phosphoesterase
MILRLLSDLHFEGGVHKELYKTQGEDILVIAGDLNVAASAVWGDLKRFAEEQPNIVYTMGNHEFYRQNYHDTCRKLEDWSRYTSIKILNPGVTYYSPITKKLEDKPIPSETEEDKSIAFIGAALWTNFRNDPISALAAASGINDFKLIEFDNRYFTPADAADLYRQHYGYIKHMYEQIKLKKVIVTHFLPCVESIDPQYLGKDGVTSTLNDYFANDLGEWIEGLENVPYFLHGHTHSNVDVTIGSTQVIAQPYGYGTNRNYKERLIDVRLS